MIQFQHKMKMVNSQNSNVKHVSKQKFSLCCSTFFRFISWCLFRPYDEFVASILGVQYAKYRVRPMWIYALAVVVSVLIGFYGRTVIDKLLLMLTLHP